MDAQAIRDVPGVKRVWQVARQQRKQVARRLKLMNADDGEQPLTFDDEIVASPAAAAAMARIAPLFDFNQRRLQHEPRVRKHPREIDELMEQIEQAALLGTQAARDFLAAGLREPHELLANNEWLDHKNLVRFEQASDLRTNGSQAAVLNFDEPVATDSVDSEAGNSLLDTGRRPGVQGF